MKGTSIEKERQWLTFLLIFALVFLRYCYYGLSYYPQLDDYIQMHNQSAYYSAKAVILDMGLLASRPLASVMDYFFWSRFWGCMMAAVGLLSALFAASACLFRAVWRRFFGTGYIFLVVYALLPLGIEGTYWVSASTRVIPALFFTALAMWLFLRWCETQRWGWLGGYFAAQLVSFCFYEQGLVLSVTGVLLVGILKLFEKNKKALWALFTFVNVGIYFAFTGYFSTASGQLGSRLKLTLPWQAGWDAVAEKAAREMGDAFLLGGYKTLGRGFRRGLALMAEKFNIIWLFLLLGLCILLFFLARRHTGESRRTPSALLVGFLMALAPVTLFFVLSNPSVALRNTVFSFCGLALMADALFGLIFRSASWRGSAAGILCVLFALGASVCSVSELHDYRETCLADQRAAGAVCATLQNGAGLRGDEKVAVLNLSPDYLTEQNYKFHEHIHGATESPWAFTGLLACTADNRLFPAATPIPMWGSYAFSLEDFDLILYYDAAAGTAVRVTAAAAEDGLIFRDNSGAALARARENNGTGVLEPAEGTGIG